MNSDRTDVAFIVQSSEDSVHWRDQSRYSAPVAWDSLERYRTDPEYRLSKRAQIHQVKRTTRTIITEEIL